MVKGSLILDVGSSKDKPWKPEKGAGERGVASSLSSLNAKGKRREVAPASARVKNKPRKDDEMGDEGYWSTESEVFGDGWTEKLKSQVAKGPVLTLDELVALPPPGPIARWKPVRHRPALSTKSKEKQKRNQWKFSGGASSSRPSASKSHSVSATSPSLPSPPSDNDSDEVYEIKQNPQDFSSDSDFAGVPKSSSKKRRRASSSKDDLLSALDRKHKQPVYVGSSSDSERKPKVAKKSSKSSGKSRSANSASFFPPPQKPAAFIPSASASSSGAGASKSGTGMTAFEKEQMRLARLKRDHKGGGRASVAGPFSEPKPKPSAPKPAETQQRPPKPPFPPPPRLPPPLPRRNDWPPPQAAHPPIALRPPPSQWSCSACTLLNDSELWECSVCMTARARSR